MLRLTTDDDEAPASYPFPRPGARRPARASIPAPAAPTDAGACSAARRVERALEDVEMKFERLRSLFARPGDDGPRAA